MNKNIPLSEKEESLIYHSSDMTNDSDWHQKSNSWFNKDDIKQALKEINKDIMSLIDHYEPYRPITDSVKAREVRKVLNTVLGILRNKFGSLADDE